MYAGIMTAQIRAEFNAVPRRPKYLDILAMAIREEA
jgi:hypothetical protein